MVRIQDRKHRFPLGASDTNPGYQTPIPRLEPSLELRHPATS